MSAFQQVTHKMFKASWHNGGNKSNEISNIDTVNK